MRYDQEELHEIAVVQRDHIRQLRDIAADFVRVIDHTQFEFEGVPTAVLSERLKLLAAMDKYQKEKPELCSHPDEYLLERVALLKRVAKAQSDAYGTAHKSNKELRASVKLYSEAVIAEKRFEALTDDQLIELNDAIRYEHKERQRKAKMEAKAADIAHASKASGNGRFLSGNLHELNAPRSIPGVKNNYDDAVHQAIADFEAE